MESEGGLESIVYPGRQQQFGGVFIDLLSPLRWLLILFSADLFVQSPLPRSQNHLGEDLRGIRSSVQGETEPLYNDYVHSISNSRTCEAESGTKIMLSFQDLREPATQPRDYGPTGVQIAYSAFA